MGALKRILKNTIILGAVGTLLALAAPVIAGVLGFSTAVGGATGLGLMAHGAFTAASSPLWVGAYFGAFGGIHAAIQEIFSDNKDPAEAPQTSTKQASQIIVVPEHSAYLAPTLGTGTKYQDLVAESRANAALQDRAV